MGNVIRGQVISAKSALFWHLQYSFKTKSEKGGGDN